MKITENIMIPNMAEDIYHADPCPTPSASRSFLLSMVRDSAQHAMLGHPRLNPDFRPDNNKDFDFGSAAHDYILRGGDKVAILDFDSYRTKDAKAEREAALKLGKLPILKEKFQTVKDMAESARVQISMLNKHNNGLTDGNPEVGIFWKEKNGMWCRAMPDWITNDGWLDDYKTTNVSGPRQWMETAMLDSGNHLQAYMALRGYHAVTGKNAKGFRFFVQEVSEPYALYCVILDNTMLEIGEAEFELGMDMFEWCMRNNEWPGYSREPYVAMPSFRANRAFEDAKAQRLALGLRDDIWRGREAA
jgi:PDDEXK-like uncharacterized protein DUF3799